MHFAAHAYIDESIKFPTKYYYNNVIGSINLLEVMVMSNVKFIIFSSTCATYGVPEKIPIIESNTQKPINPYGTSKLVVEQILKNYDKVRSIRSVVLRYFNAAGADLENEIGEWHEPEPHLIPKIINVALGNKKTIRIYGNDYNTPDGTCIRDYVHVKDLATAHVLSLKYLLKEKKSEIFNLGTGNGNSVYEIIEKTNKLTETIINARISQRRKGDPDVLVANAEKAKLILGWEPKYSSIDIILKTAIDWYKNGRKNYETK